jgi:hypothetical protein
MELKSLTEHIEQCLSEKAVQSSVEGHEKPKKKRQPNSLKGYQSLEPGFAKTSPGHSKAH